MLLVHLHVVGPTIALEMFFISQFHGDTRRTRWPNIYGKHKTLVIGNGCHGLTSATLYYLDSISSFIGLHSLECQAVLKLNGQPLNETQTSKRASDQRIKSRKADHIKNIVLDPSHMMK